MICFKCGAEIPEGSTICPVCHADLTLEFAQTDPQETGSVSGGDSPASETAPSSGSLPSVPEEPKPGKKGMKILIAAGVVAAAGAAAAFAFTQMNAKDPKEAVVDAFQTAFSHEQVSPAEDIFGLSQFSSASVSSDAEAGLTLSLDSSSMEELNALTGGGLRISSRNDVSNKKSDANVGVVYNGMDVVNLDLYYGDHTLMAAIPELSEKVLTMDLGDGLADRHLCRRGSRLSDGGHCPGRRKCRCGRKHAGSSRPYGPLQRGLQGPGKFQGGADRGKD